MDMMVTGSVAYDYLMRFPGHFAEHLLSDHLDRISVSFLVEDMTKVYGGNGGNIAYTLGLFGLRPKLFATVGRDFDAYGDWLTEAGVDISTIRRIDEVFMPSFFANIDLDNNQIGSFYSGAMSYAKQYQIRDVYAGLPDLVIISPNDPQAMSNLCAECRERGIKFIYDPSQQVARLSGDELRSSMQAATMLICNDYEAMVITQKTGLSLDDMQVMFPVLIVTQGKNGSHIYTNGVRVDVPVFETDTIKDPTGVGDAYRAGVMCGIAHELPWKIAGEIGALCATYALEHVGTQIHAFTIEEFIARFRTQFDDDSALDRLLTPLTATAQQT